MKCYVYRPGAIVRKNDGNLQAGVLEVKMKNRLKVDMNSIGKMKSPVKLKSIDGQSEALKNLPVAAKRIVLGQEKMKKRGGKSIPPLSGAYKKRAVEASNFPTAYIRGQLPIMIQHQTGGSSLRWTQNVDELDFCTLLPLFVEGIREQQKPYSFLATQGLSSMLKHGVEEPEKVHGCLHKIIQPLRTALNSRHPDVILRTLQCIMDMLQIDGIGVALLPYYRQLLPVMNIFRTQRHNLGDGMDYSQKSDLSNMIQNTLELMEKTGGPDAFINLKYMIPTYEGTNIV